MLNKFLLSTFLFGLSLVLTAQPSDVRKAIHEGILTAEAINKLTAADIPKEWQSVRSVVETENNTTTTFSRDGQKILDITWSKKWIETKGHWFAGVIYKDGEQVAKIVRTKSLVVLPTASASKVSVVTEISDEGAVTVGVLNPNGTLIDSIVIDGRSSRLMNDLEFTKAKLIGELAIQPLMEAMGEGLRDARRQKTESK